MASKTKKCRFCGTVHPKNATKCELCGRPLTNNRHNLFKLITGVTLVIVLIATIYLMQKVSLDTTGSIHAPRLELISSAGYASVSGEMIVEGKIRNIGGEMLENIQVVVSWYDKQGNKLSEVSSAIYLNYILSFQVSPFRVTQPNDSRMGSYDISFTSSQGELIYTRDMREKAEGVRSAG